MVRSCDAMLLWGLLWTLRTAEPQPLEIGLWSDPPLPTDEQRALSSPPSVALVELGYDTRVATTTLEAEQQTKAREAIQAIQTAYAAQDWPGMLATIDALEAQILARIGSVSACRALWDVEFQRFLAFWGRGDTGDAFRAQLHAQLARRIDPSRTPSIAMYGPDVATAFQSTDDKPSTEPQTVPIHVEPTYASLSIDCQLVEESQRNGPPLEAGLHVVSLWALGLEPQNAIVDPRTTERIDGILAPRDDLEAAIVNATIHHELSLGTDASNNALRRWAAQRGQPILVVLKDGETQAGLFHAQVVTPLANSRVHTNARPVRAAQQALAELSSQGRIRVMRPEPRVELVEGTVKPRRIKRRTAIGIGVGVGFALVLAAAVAAAVGLSVQQETSPTLEVTVVPSRQP